MQNMPKSSRTAKRVGMNGRSIFALSYNALLISILFTSMPATHASILTNSDPALQDYDVVSIKANRSTSGAVGYEHNQDGFTLTNAPMSMMLSMAYGLRDRRIIGLPSWTVEQRFDLTAKCLQPSVIGPAGIPAEARKAMMLNMLKDRFGLKAHQSRMVLPVYTLLPDKGGAHLKQSAPNEPVYLVVNRGEAHATSASLSSLADALSGLLDRDIINMVPGDAKYDVELKWNASELSTAPGVGLEEPELPSIFTAIKSQLGLRLVPSRESIDVIVVDEIHQPTPN